MVARELIDPWALSGDESIPEVSGEGFQRRIGRKKGFIPILGEVVWELPRTLADRTPFSAYICEVASGYRLGYVRVPHYHFDEAVADRFAGVIARFEENTTAMVFDQTDNPGGNMFAMYAIASALTDRPLPVPTHQLKLDERDLAMAEKTIALAEAGESVPWDQRPSNELISYARCLISEVNSGRGLRGILTNPVHLGGIMHITPGEPCYTKAIYVVINELTFSAGEFLAAILQDSRRATLVGTRTAGAGGCARSFTHEFRRVPLAPLELTLTWTIARRSNGQYIENYGVHPDIECHVTAEDVRTGYASYGRALVSTIFESPGA